MENKFEANPSTFIWTGRGGVSINLRWFRYILRELRASKVKLVHRTVLFFQNLGCWISVIYCMNLVETS